MCATTIELKSEPGLGNLIEMNAGWSGRGERMAGESNLHFRLSMHEECFIIWPNQHHLKTNILKEGMECSSLVTDADPSIHYSSSSARSLVVPQSCQFGHKIVLVDFLFRFVGPTVVVADVAHGSCDGGVVGSGRRFDGWFSLNGQLSEMKHEQSSVDDYDEY